MALKISPAGLDVQLQAVAALANGGYLQMYTGIRPPDADSPPCCLAKLFGELRFSDPAFRKTSQGLTTNKITEGKALFSGEPTWFRILTADRRPIMDGNFGGTKGDLVWIFEIKKGGRGPERRPQE